MRDRSLFVPSLRRLELHKKYEGKRINLREVLGAKYEEFLPFAHDLMHTLQELLKDYNSSNKKVDETEVFGMLNLLDGLPVTGTMSVSALDNSIYFLDSIKQEKKDVMSFCFSREMFRWMHTHVGCVVKVPSGFVFDVAYGRHNEFRPSEKRMCISPATCGDGAIFTQNSFGATSAAHILQHKDLIISALTELAAMYKLNNPVEGLKWL